MSWMDYLDQIRQKPVAVKQRLLLIWTFSITLVIVLLWLINLFLFMPQAGTEDILHQQQRFQDLKTNISEPFKQIMIGFEFLQTLVTDMF